MAESTLSLDYTALKKEVGHNLGYTRQIDVWDSAQLEDVVAYIENGERQFYFPPPIDGEPPYEWSFLRPTLTLSISSGDYDYNLPDNFSGMLGTFTGPAGGDYDPIQIVPDVIIRSFRSNDNKSGKPKYAAIRVRDTAGADGQRYEVIFYPTPNASTTFTYRAAIVPPAMADATPYPLGGGVHSETLLASCLSAVELHKNGELGVYYQRFIERLRASIELEKHTERIQIDGPWPVEEPPETLDLSYSQLMQQVGHELGFGYHWRNFNYSQQRTADVVVQNGMRRFLQAHRWSFLYHRGTITTKANIRDYTLPPDFGGIQGTIYFRDAANIYRPIRVTSESQIESYRSTETTPVTSWPQMAAIQSIMPDQTQPQRFQILLWPTPTAEYTLAYLYRTLAHPLSEDRNPFPLGSADHAHTILEACLAAAERHNKVMGGQHEQAFLSALVDSKARDGELAAPTTLGCIGNNEGIYYSRFRSATYIPGP